MNDGTLMRKNLFRKPVRTALLLISIFIAFLIFAMTVAFYTSLNNIRSLPTRMVTLSKINFTETLPIAYFDRVRRQDGVMIATHANWFGGYYQDPARGFAPTFAVDPETYLQVYADDIPLSQAQRDAFIGERTALIAHRAVADRFGWREGQRVPLNSNIFSKADGSSSWDFTVAAIFDGPTNSSQTGTILIHYDYYNETITFGRDRIGLITFLTRSSDLNDSIAQAIDRRFANSTDETSTQDEAAFNAAFAGQLGNIGLAVSLVVGAAFAAILLIVGTTMSLAVRERTNEVGVMKTLGFRSGRILRIILGESMLLSLLGAVLGLGTAWLAITALSGPAAAFAPLSFPPIVILWGLLIAVALGFVTGFPPAWSAYRMRIVDAFARR